MFGIDTNLSFILGYIALISLAWKLARSLLKKKKGEKKNLVNALIIGVIWIISYLVIRVYLNPDISNVTEHTDAAIFGGLASFTSTLVKDLLISS